MANNGRTRRGDRSDDRPAIWVGYGRVVKLFRERAGMTQPQLATAVGYSYEQVASIEQGRRPAKAQFTEAAEEVLDTRGALNALQDEVDLAKLPMFFQDFAIIEMDAVSRFECEPLLIPGLLQTEAYARALFSRHCPKLSAEIIDQHADARMNRQKLLTRAPAAELSFIIGEIALTNQVGSDEVMRLQLEHLLEVGSTESVEVQVMPTNQGFCSSYNGAFVYLETLEHRHFGYVESQEVGVVVSEPARVSTFGLRYGKLRSQALNVAESARLIERLVGET